MKKQRRIIFEFFYWYSLAVLHRKQLLTYFLFSTALFISSAQETSNFSHLDRTFRYHSQIAFDSMGYAWISSEEGLYKYDGYDYMFIPNKDIFGADYKTSRKEILKKDAKENFWLATYSGELTRIDARGNFVSFKDSIRINKYNPRISAIQPERDFVWFGSANGTIYKYDYFSSKIDSVTAVPKLRKNSQEIRSIAFTDERTMWISTYSGIIYQYSDNHLQRLEGPYHNAIASIVHVVSDDMGFLWITSEYKGLFSFEVEKSKFIKYDLDDGFVKNKNNAPFISLFYDDGKIWAGTDGNGLYRIDVATQEVTAFKHKITNKFSLSNNTVAEINKDYSGNIWVSTKGGYIDILPNINNNIKYFSGSEDDAPTAVLSILKSTNDVLWIGTDGNGLTRISTNGKSTQFNHEKKGKHFFNGKYIQRLVEDSRNNIWIGTYQNGLYVYNLEKEEFKKIPIRDRQENTSADIRFLFEDSEHRIWATSSIGVHIFAPDTRELASFRYDAKNGLSGIISESIAQTSDGTIWIGVNKAGLFRFKENSENIKLSSFESIKLSDKDSLESRNYAISTMIVDVDDNLWIQGRNIPLLNFNTKNHNSQSYGEKKELNNVDIRAILLDSTQHLWLSSGSGLHEYNSKNGNVKSFYKTDGLQGNSYKRRSAYKSKDGMLFFGGENGVNGFFAKSLLQREIAPKLFINSIEILNKPASAIIPEQLSTVVENVKFLDLKSQQASFSFRFSAIENILNTNYYYAYRLKGFDEEWITPKSERTATYTNVPSGNYIFEVRAGTKIGTWDIGTRQIEIEIHPPWWKSGWAYTIYILLLLIICMAAYRWFHLRNKMQKEEWDHANEKEIYALKMDFFAKMSHEIQTPLTLILGPIDDMLQKATVNKNRLLLQRLTLIKNNAERLSRISADLTSIRNKELNQLKIRASNNNIIKELKQIALSFAEQARFKKIDFIQEFPNEEIYLWYDSDKIEHVFYNLLSNAFKFTPTEGTIKLIAHKINKKECIKISVIDSGPGIPNAELKDIFTLFYQSEIGRKLKGSGIGLALTKELVELHHGTIKASSSKETGTSFHVHLSLREDNFKAEEKISPKETEPLEAIGAEDMHVLEQELTGTFTENDEKIYHVLVVEDNVEMQIFLKDLLHERYWVTIAANGQEGIQHVAKNSPDLIISDIMMPIMDGVEMTKFLQKNKLYSYIPIILLTAKNTTKSKLLGLESGAVAYINKPFNPQELMIRAKNLIKNNENSTLRAKTDFISGSQKELPTSKDHLFLKELVANLQEQLENSAFKLEELSDTMNMSYSVIFRKCQEITGKTLVEFFRSLKIKRAALLIIEQQYNISEAAFMVGYKDPKYFTKCFKDEFGKPPATLKKESKKMELSEFMKKYKIQKN